eukprot:2583613-Pyramimonas_sp.AAC.1
MQPSRSWIHTCGGEIARSLCEVTRSAGEAAVLAVLGAGRAAPGRCDRAPRGFRAKAQTALRGGPLLRPRAR